MNLNRFPILLTSTLIVAGTALFAPADAAEHSFWSSLVPYIEVQFSAAQACPPPAPVCAPVYQPVCAPPVSTLVWVDAAYGHDAYGCRTFIPGHYEQRLSAQLIYHPENRFPEPRFPERRSAPPSHFPEHGGPGYHDDGRSPAHHDDHGPAFRR